MDAVDLDRTWHKFRSQAGLRLFRLHDLCHSFASVAVISGFDLKVESGLLGHADLSATQAYAHLDAKTGKAASKCVGVHLSKSFSTKPRGLRSRKASLYERFIRSPLSISEFCETNTLDLDEPAPYIGQRRSRCLIAMGGKVVAKDNSAGL